MDPLFPLWLVVIVSVSAGIGVGVVIERSFGTAARRAARLEADLVQSRSELMQFREETKHHFGKSAELLGRMATDYREFLDHFVTGAENLCGPGMKELNANGLERPLLDATPSTAEPAPLASAPPPLAASLDRDPLAEDVAK
jgi:uncharacterized membrane-anchored protein YhcB (DUF1043 family)